MALGIQENEVKSSENIIKKASIPLSDYDNKLEPKVKKRYLEKISAIGIDPVLIEGKNFEPDCLPLEESTDLLFYLVSETGYYTKQQFKAFRSLQAYNQMVSGFISSVQGHIVKDNFVVIAKVRHSQRMNDSLIPVWIITEKQGTNISAHCCGCKAGLGESCSHVASVLLPQGMDKNKWKNVMHASQVFVDSTFICEGSQVCKSSRYQFYFSKENEN